MKKIVFFLIISSLISCSNNTQENNQTSNQTEEQFRDSVKVLARINNFDINERAFNLYKKGISISDPNLSDEEILNKLIDFELVSQKAKEEGLMTQADVVARIHLQTNELLSDLYIKQFIATSANEVMLMSEYESMKRKSGNQEMLLRHIMTDTRSQIESLKKQVEEYSFEQIANINDQNTLGGLIGWVVPSEMIPPIRDVLLNLPTNQVSDVIESEFGYHLIKVDQIRPTEFLSFEKAKPGIRINLVTRKMNELLQNLRMSSDIEIYEDFAN